MGQAFSAFVQSLNFTIYENLIYLVLSWGWMWPGGCPGLQNQWGVAQSKVRWVRLPCIPVLGMVQNMQKPALQIVNGQWSIVNYHFSMVNE